MRLIIDNDKFQLYARTDYVLSEITLLNSASIVGATSITVVNPSGFATNDFILIEDIGNERAEMRQITVSGNDFAITALSFAHTSKVKIYRLQYNKVKFFEGDTVLATVDITPDYFTKTTVDVVDTNEYSIAYLNSASSEETPEGEVLNGYEYNLCSIGDCLQYESNGIDFGRMLDKINIASREIRSMFISQDQNFTDLSSRDIGRLREPCSLRALYFNFVELIKNDDDVPSKKAELYMGLYNAKLKEIMDVINKENDNIAIWGQTRALR